VERLEVTLDGTPVPADRTTFEVAGVEGPADEPWWPVLASGHVRVTLGAAPDDGEHDVHLVMGTRIPYLVDPAGHAVVIVDRALATVSR
jgi:hypothetical protein